MSPPLRLRGNPHFSRKERARNGAPSGAPFVSEKLTPEVKVPTLRLRSGQALTSQNRDVKDGAPGRYLTITARAGDPQF
jgi:hypothetical protein